LYLWNDFVGGIGAKLTQRGQVELKAQRAEPLWGFYEAGL